MAASPFESLLSREAMFSEIRLGTVECTHVWTRTSTQVWERGALAVHVYHQLPIIDADG